MTEKDCDGKNINSDTRIVSQDRILPEKSAKIFYSNIETLKTQGICGSNFQDI